MLGKGENKAMKYNKSEAKEFAQENFKGIFAAGMTPFKADSSIDEAGLRCNLHHWIDELNIDGLFVNGKQGEFFSMTLSERKRQFEIVVEEVGERCRTIMSCSDENLDTVLELGHHAQNIGADWIIVHAPPLYFHNNVDAVLKEYYRCCKDSPSLAFCCGRPSIISGNCCFTEVKV